MSNKKTFFQCFSINFHRFLKANGLRSMSKSTHPNGKTFWVYERTEDFEKCLKIWHETAPNKKGTDNENNLTIL
jgi:hypothetical protein